MRGLVFGLLSCVCSGAAAHDFWIQPDAFSMAPSATLSLVLNIGHAEARQRSPIARDRITRFEVIAPNGARTDLRPELRGARQEHDGSVRVQAPGTYVIVLETDDRAWSYLPSDRFNEYAADEGLAPALRQREGTGRMEVDATEKYSRRAKALVHVRGAASAQSAVTEPLGLSLEIVPEVDPYAKPIPASLPVRVIYEGRPLAGALVKLTDLDDDAQPVETHVTDPAGRARFVMPASGNWLVNVVWTRPLPSSDETDFATTFSSLTFGLPDR